MDPWSGEQQLEAFSCRCAEEGYVGCVCFGSAPGCLDATDADASLRLWEVGGFGLDTVVARPQTRIDLPRVIPVVDESSARQGVLRPAVAVGLQAWPDSIGASAHRAESLAERLRLPQHLKTVLVPFASDVDLERLWIGRHQGVRHLAQLRPDLVVVPSFSQWDGDPRAEQQYARKRCFEFYRFLQNHGQAAVVHVDWSSQADAQELCSWLDQNEVDWIVVDAQCLASSADRWLAQLAWVKSRLTAPPNLLASGLHSAKHLTQLVRTWPNMSVIYNGLPLARSHRELALRPDGSTARLRYGPPTERSALIDLGRDPEPATLYRHSIRTLERIIANALTLTLPPINADLSGRGGQPVTPRPIVRPTRVRGSKPARTAAR
ncbi:MAG: hypothetical protein ABSE70_06650 [Candidatus Limnocylindrales bacterium]